MSDKDRVRLFEKVTALVVKQVGDRFTLDTTGFDLPRALLPEGVADGQSIRLTVTIESPHTRSEWSRAYARQGASDLKVYRFLSTPEARMPDASVGDCHRLHYLQMSGEKIAKAYQFRHTTKRIDDLLSHHVALPEFIKLYCQSGPMRTRYAGRDAQLVSVRRDLHNLATEIEKLAPAVTGRPRAS